MNPRNLPKQIRKDLETATDVLTSDRPCNALWLTAAAALLEDVAAQVRAAIAEAEKSGSKTAACQAAGF
jgi:hypothetical protein